MTGSAGLEQGYRRLLGWYPRAFRRDHADEILGVLMAGAGEGQRRPRLTEAADLLWSGLKMRLRGPALTGESRPWSDALALFSLVAPLFLLLADVLVVALPYRLRPVGRFRFVRTFGSHPEIGGLSLLRQPIFDVTVGLGVLVAILVLLGLRWMALAAMAAAAVYWVAARQMIPWIPYPLQLLTAGGYLLETAALIASPGPRRGRQLVNWRYGVVLLVGAAAVQLSTFWYDARSQSLVPGPRPAGTADGVAGQQRRAGRGRGDPGAGLEAEPVPPAPSRGDVLPLRDGAGLHPLQQRR